MLAVSIAVQNADMLFGRCRSTLLLNSVWKSMTVYRSAAGIGLLHGISPICIRISVRLRCDVAHNVMRLMANRWPIEISSNKVCIVHVVFHGKKRYRPLYSESKYCKVSPTKLVNSCHDRVTYIGPRAIAAFQRDLPGCIATVTTKG